MRIAEADFYRPDALIPGFHHSVAVLPFPFRRSAVVKFRCSVQIKKIRSGADEPRLRGTQRQRQRQRRTETATANGNGERNGGNRALLSPDLD